MLTRLKIWLGITPKEVMFKKAQPSEYQVTQPAPAKKAPAKKAPAKKAPAKKAPAKKAPAKKVAKKSSGGGKGLVAL